MTSTFILFRSLSLLYQTENFFKIEDYLKWNQLQLCYFASDSVNGRAGQWATENYEFHGKEDALGVQEGCRMCLSTEIVKLSSFWLVYGWTIYIYNIKKKKLRENVWVFLYQFTLGPLNIRTSISQMYQFHACIFLLIVFKAVHGSAITTNQMHPKTLYFGYQMQLIFWHSFSCCIVMDVPVSLSGIGLGVQKLWVRYATMLLYWLNISENF